jgi:hypothetical protein
MRHLIAAVAIAWIAACEAGSPTAPAVPGSDAGVISIDVSCPLTLLIGERAPCVAVARLRSGRQATVGFESTWSSARPDVVAVDMQGVVTGRSAGQATVSGLYGGREGVATIVVTAEDALRLRAAADQGEFRPGATVTMWLQGYYSVASADTARLSLRITDQTGVIAASQPLAVSRGGDFFLLSSTFVVPQGSSRVCRTAVLEVGSAQITEPSSTDSDLWCVAVRP